MDGSRRIAIAVRPSAKKEGEILCSYAAMILHDWC